MECVNSVEFQKTGLPLVGQTDSPIPKLMTLVESLIVAWDAQINSNVFKKSSGVIVCCFRLTHPFSGLFIMNSLTWNRRKYFSIQ